MSGGVTFNVLDVVVVGVCVEVVGVGFGVGFGVVLNLTKTHFATFLRQKTSTSLRAKRVSKIFGP